MNDETRADITVRVRANVRPWSPANDLAGVAARLVERGDAADAAIALRACAALDEEAGGAWCGLAAEVEDAAREGSP